MLNFLLATSGSSGHSFWILLAGILLGAVALAVWAVTYLRRRGYFERAADPAELFPVVTETDKVRRAA